MVGSLNKVILIGNVGASPDIKTSIDGKKIATFSLATSETWKDKTGEKKEKTDWHRIVVFSQGLAEIVERYVSKGSKLFLEGSLQTRKYTDPSTGIEKYTTEVVLQNFNSSLILLSPKSPGGSDSRAFDTGNYKSDDFESYVEDDKLPF